MAETVAIIGAGPAGLAAAIQLKRYGLQPLLIEQSNPGGLLLNANLVENYLGFPGGIPGPELASLFEHQASMTGVQITTARVVSVNFKRIFEIHTTAGAYQTEFLVIASGTRPKRLPGLAVQPAIQNRLYYEVYPLREVHGKQIAVIGAGDAAFDYALNLSQRNQVALLNRSAKLNCLPLLWERACGSANIHYHANTEVGCVKPAKPTGLLLECLSPDGNLNLGVDFLVAAIGREPQADFLAVEFLRQAETLKQQGKLYFIGDVKNDIYRQTSIAAGEGIMAAMKIYQKYKEDPA